MPGIFQNVFNSEYNIFLKCLKVKVFPLPGSVRTLHDIDDDDPLRPLYHDAVGQAVANRNIDIISES